ncbi:MAG: fused response regulator/phosphatase [Planctomicrobium sp.]|nr:fused response regulator/phosphatase [Planctomicrobium sp.]
MANCLKEAFELISKSNFQAILLDLGLPDGTGIEILHKVRKFSSNIPIIILTGNEDDTLGVEALRSGADDFLKKSSISEDTLPRSVRYSIERNFRLLAEAQLHRTQAEIIAAETIQQKLLPDFSPEVVDYDIYGACHPAEKIGGDLFDYLSFDDTSCVGVVADVSGHGLPAAILMTELHGLLHGLIEQNVSLPRLMSAANIRTDKATESYQFITMISYHLSAENHSFSYISAGHPAWILKGDGTEVVLKSQYLPLGVDTKKKRLSLTQVRVESGDILVLPTDGVFEALGINGERFSVERMLKEIRNNKGLSAKEIVHHVLDCAKEFSLDHRLTDDCTLVVIKAC